MKNMTEFVKFVVKQTAEIVVFSGIAAASGVYSKKALKKGKNVNAALLKTVSMVAASFSLISTGRLFVMTNAVPTIDITLDLKK